MKTIRYTKVVMKSIQRMQPKRRNAIIARIEAFASGETVDLKKLQGSPYFRIRVGSDRIILDDQGLVVMIIDAGPRGGIYKD